MLFKSRKILHCHSFTLQFRQARTMSEVEEGVHFLTKSAHMRSHLTNTNAWLKKHVEKHSAAFPQYFNYFNSVTHYHASYRHNFTVSHHSQLKGMAVSRLSNVLQQIYPSEKPQALFKNQTSFHVSHRRTLFARAVNSKKK